MNAPAKIERAFLPADFSFESWEELKPIFEDLESRQLGGKSELKRWLRDLSELEAFYAENLAWRYIRMSTDTESEERKNAYQFFVNEIQPKAAPFFDQFNRKLLHADGVSELRQEPGYAILLRNTQKSVDLFREENIALNAEMATRSQEYGTLVGKMTIEHNGQTYTLPQAGVLLQSDSRKVREDVFNKIARRRLEDKEAVDGLMDALIEIRHRIATNAEYKNYRDYKFDDLKRFDYSAEDCFLFHESVEKVIHPLVQGIHEDRRKALGVSDLKPFDLQVDFRGNEPLRPFSNSRELIDKGIEVMRRVHPFFGKCIEKMDQMGHLDLDSRSGKAPGGYNYPLYESGYPFIFMNAAGTQTDLTTFVHEAGHAVHSVLTQELELTDFKSCPSEVAELASMSMELISMSQWDVFYDDPADLKRAQLDQLERAAGSLTWIATIDNFQHWLYENPEHTHAERIAAWEDIYTRFHSELNWNGMAVYRDHLWQKQLHLFEVPFYYIEYGMAQLGAIAVYRNFKEDPEKALEQYIAALKLGNTRTIPEVYREAGIRFDFSADYLVELSEFISGEIRKLHAE